MDSRYTSRAHRATPRRENSALRIAIAALALVAVGAIVFTVAQKRQPIASMPMRATVQLDNRCELIDDAFMAVSEPDGSRAYFQYGLALLDTHSDAFVTIRASDRYPGVVFETKRMRAAEHLLFTVDCGLSDRLERTLEGLREQFRSK